MKSPYLTAEEAAEYLRYTNVSAFRQAAKRKRVPSLLRGRNHLYLETNLIRYWSSGEDRGPQYRRRHPKPATIETGDAA